MRKVMVRYKVKAGMAEENENLIKAVFEELEKNSPNGLKYASSKLEDGLTFIHIASIETELNPLSETEAFKKFQENLKDRCDEAPQATELNLIGNYDLF